jgi:hypothetical protein
MRLLSLIQFVQENLTQDVFEGFWNFKTRVKTIRTVKNADRLVLLAKKETVLKGMTDILFVIGRCYAMEKNAEKLG